ncbi:hypothetical protein AJ79_06792 [Helicocarpus griseus UAMH5409]|uniref:ATP synthase mitochondrial F1 complex assembly factor 1 n=1 Tax=Helicocarpus griseus UAMH5409 TaxID=1447875 RepID=A0A2B7X945_9EURO|nr:hypothetical protein AJ79_06792 [Helicocarpus griseus UAMH5409]
MASMRAPAIRNIIGTNKPLLGPVQRRWAQVHDVRFLTTHHDPNRVLEKYKEKLDRKAKEEGHASIDSLKQAYQDKIKDLKAKAESIPQPTSSTPQSPNGSPAATSTTTAAKSAQSPISSSIPKSPTPGIKPLSSYLDIPKILTLPAKEIETLWRLRHASNPQSICATIPLDTYMRMVNVARQNPQFVLPLPRTEASSQPEDAKDGVSTDPHQAASTGADIHFLQWGFHPPASVNAATQTTNASTLNTHTSTVLFTHLASYKLHGSYSQPHTVITHHLDLADEKGLILMNGNVLPDRGVAVDEAKLLVMWLQRFYDWGVDGQQGGKKAELVRMFSQGDVQGFKLEDLMAEVEKV